MSRRSRLQFAGAVYHVMARGNRKSTIFHDDEDRRQFVQLVGRAARSYDLRIMATCLMGNHYHFIVETPARNLSDAMHFINGVFAQRSNRRHGQTGHVFEGRFRSLIIQQESYLMRAARYVVRNPVRAGLVTDAGAWPWSSYGATAGLERAPSCCILIGFSGRSGQTHGPRRNGDTSLTSTRPPNHNAQFPWMV